MIHSKRMRRNAFSHGSTIYFDSDSLEWDTLNGTHFCRTRATRIMNNLLIKSELRLTHFMLAYLRFTQHDMMQINWNHFKSRCSILSVFTLSRSVVVCRKHLLMIPFGERPICFFALLNVQRLESVKEVQYSMKALWRWNNFGYIESFFSWISKLNFLYWKSIVKVSKAVKIF